MSETLTITIPQTETIHYGDQPFTSYSIAVKYNDSNSREYIWFISKRFRTIVQLNDYLKCIVIIPDGFFPKKFTFNKLDPTVVEKRRLQLENYFQFVAKTQQVVQDSNFRAFLEVDRNIKLYSKVVPDKIDSPRASSTKQSNTNQRPASTNIEYPNISNQPLVSVSPLPTIASPQQYYTPVDVYGNPVPQVMTIPQGYHTYATLPHSGYYPPPAMPPPLPYNPVYPQTAPPYTPSVMGQTRYIYY